MPLFGPPDVEALKTKGDIPGLIRALRYQAASYEHMRLRQAAVLALAQIGGPRAVDPLIEAFKDVSPDVRIAAIGGLGDIGDARAVGPLIARQERATGPESDAIARSLVKIGAPAVEPLIAGLRHERRSTREFASEVLGKIGDPRAVGALVATLRDWEHWVRQRAAEALVRIGASAVEPLAALLAGEGTCEVYEPAAAALDRLGWQPDSATPRARAAYWVAKKWLERCVEVGAAALEPLAAALQSTDEQVRRRAAEVLGRLGDPRAAELLLGYLRRVGQWALADFQQSGLMGCLPAIRATMLFRKEAPLGALVSTGAAAVPPLIGALEDSNWIVRMGAVEALGEIGDPRAAAPLVYRLGDPSEDVRAAAARALGKTGDAGAVSPLTAALKDPGGSVASGAAEALGRLGQRAEEAIPALVQAMSAGDCYLRRSAATALGGMGDGARESLPALVAALGDEVDEVRKAAAMALEAITGQTYGEDASGWSQWLEAR